MSAKKLKVNSFHRSLSFVFLLLLIVCTFLLPASFIQGKTNNQYFPLGLLTEWTYDSMDNTTSWTTRRYVSDEYQFLGIHFMIFFNEEHDGVWQNKMWLSKTKNSLVWWGFENEFAKAIAKKGLTYVIEPIEIGDSQGGKTEVTLTIKTDPVQTSTENFEGEYIVEDIASVTVPGGTFDNCIKVHEKEITPDGVADFFVWYAPDIGPIKYYYPLRDNRTDVLIDYSIIDDDPFESWFLPKVPVFSIILGSVLIAIIIIIVIVVIVIKRKRKKSQTSISKEE
jgi:hypothetical protein